MSDKPLKSESISECSVYVRKSGCKKYLLQNRGSIFLKKSVRKKTHGHVYIERSEEIGIYGQ